MSQAALDSTILYAERQKEIQDILRVRAQAINLVSQTRKVEETCEHARLGRPEQCPNYGKRKPYCERKEGFLDCF